MKTLVRVVGVVLALLALAFPAGAQQGMSDSEKKATARAAFTEGLKLQEEGKPAEALTQFETAQKFFDAPTHLLHIAECQSLTGKLVESVETYETLLRRNLGPNPSAAFVDAQDRARATLPGVRARTPTLKITTKPEAKDLKNLQIGVNGTQFGADIVGLARPVNPGAYKIVANATGYKLAAPVDVTIAEKESKLVELTLVVSTAPAVVVAPAPPPYTPATTNAPPPFEPAKVEPPKPSGPSSAGLLFGLSGSVLIPGGGVTKSSSSSGFGGGSRTGADRNFDTVASTGGQLGIDVMFRLAKILLLGASLNLGGLSGPSDLANQAPAGADVKTSTSTQYFGFDIGILPNVDKVSFYGKFGLGYRHLGRTITLESVEAKESLGGVEAELALGLMIPAGPLRFLPKAGLTAGSFSNVDSNCTQTLKGNFGSCLETTGNDTVTHTFFYVGLGVLYHLDFTKKPPVQ